MRPVYQSEQPEVLHRELKKTRVVGEAPEPLPKTMEVNTGIFTGLIMLICSMITSAWNTISCLWKNRETPANEEPSVSIGLPHGVVDATVYMENVRVENEQGVAPSFYFCHTRNYVADRQTTGGADNGRYPSVEKSNVSVECEVPPSGYYPALTSVSINGAVNVKILKFGVTAPEELKQLVAAGA